MSNFGLTAKLCHSFGSKEWSYNSSLPSEWWMYLQRWLRTAWFPMPYVITAGLFRFCSWFSLFGVHKSTRRPFLKRAPCKESSSYSFNTGGALSGPVAHSLFGCGPISKIKIPPLTISECRIHVLSNDFPFSVADWMYLFFVDTLLALIVNWPFS